MVNGRDTARADRARADVGAELAVAGDLSEPGAAEDLVAETAKALGPVQCLVNNVGEAYQVGFEELTDEQWDQMWQLNVMSYVRCIRAVLPGMKEAGTGTIVNVSSTAGKRPSTGMPNYSVTKAAVLLAPRLVADLYAKHGSAAMLSRGRRRPRPGSATEAWQTSGQPPLLRRVNKCSSRRAGRPLGRLAEPEIASVIAFLCSERASYVTGSA